MRAHRDLALEASSISIGRGLEIDVLTGRGSLVGLLFGVLFTGALNNGLVEINISPYVQQHAVDAALIFAATLDIVYQRLDVIQLEEAKTGVKLIVSITDTA